MHSRSENRVIGSAGPEEPLHPCRANLMDDNQQLIATISLADKRTLAFLSCVRPGNRGAPPSAELRRMAASPSRRSARLSGMSQVIATKNKEFGNAR